MQFMTQASTNPSKGDGKTLATAYEFTVDEGTEIKLTALVSNITGVEKDAKWTETATGAVISTTKGRGMIIINDKQCGVPAQFTPK